MTRLHRRDRLLDGIQQPLHAAATVLHACLPRRESASFIFSLQPLPAKPCLQFLLSFDSSFTRFE